MSAHTPGPWEISYNVTASPAIWIDAKLNAGIAKIEINQEEDWANARLIAAAPELLEVARIAILSDTWKKAKHASLFDKARAAIAKAEGRV